MKFKIAEHKQLVQELIKTSNFPGAILELALDLKHSVEKSEITDIMSFDRVEHKQLLQELLKANNFPGSILELVYDLKTTIESSTLEEQQ